MSKTTTGSKNSPGLTVVPDPRNPGFTARGARLERALEQYRAQVEQENKTAEASGNAAPHPVVEDEAQRRLAELLSRSDPAVYKQWVKLAPVSTSPRRDGFFDKVEAAAIRRTKQGRELSDLLSGRNAPRGRGRPSDRRLPVAVFERNIFETGRPEVRRNVREFLGSDALLDWAYNEPVRDATCGVHERSVLDTMKGALDRHSVDEAVRLNIEALKELAAQHQDVGRYWVVDGTHIQVNREQHKT
jgi:hypothetical protein